MAVCLAAAFFFAWTTRAQAATPKLSYKKIWIQAGTNEGLSVKGTKKVKWSVASGKDKITLSSKKATSVKVKAKKSGVAVVKARASSKTIKCKVNVFSESDAESLHISYYGSLRVKKNHVLYNANGKAICKDVLDVDGDGSEGFWVLKVDRSLYHYIVSGTTVAPKYKRSKKVLSGVKELTENMGRLGCKYTYVLKSNGTVYRLTRKTKNGSYINSYKTKKYMTGVEHVYHGYNWGDGNVFALKKDGSLWGWGDNEYGEMANGKTSKVKKPRQVMTGVRDFFLFDECWGMASYGNACFALKDGGELYGWGFNYGDIPGGDYEKATTPVKVKDDIAVVHASENVVTAIDGKKQLWLWGRYSTHVEGFSVNFDTFSPTVVAQDVKYADSETIGAYYITEDGTLYRIRLRGTDPVDEYLNAPAKVMTGVKTFSAQNGYALRTDGTLWHLTVSNDKVSKKKKIDSGF